MGDSPTVNANTETPFYLAKPQDNTTDWSKSQIEKPGEAVWTQNPEAASTTQKKVVKTAKADKPISIHTPSNNTISLAEKGAPFTAIPAGAKTGIDYFDKSLRKANIKAYKFEKQLAGAGKAVKVAPLIVAAAGIVLTEIDAQNEYDKQIARGRLKETAEHYKKKARIEGYSRTAGAAIGTTIGGVAFSFIPVPGATYVGMVVGGLAGELAGEYIGAYLAGEYAE